LSQAEFTVLVASNGREALDLYTQHHPSIVITDWNMPDMNGIELCRAIRAESRELYTYIIMLTGLIEKDHVVTGLEAGADEYLTKPFHAAELLARVRVGRRIVGLHDELARKSLLLEQLALTDPLTGLPNRRALDEWVRRELSGADRHGYPVWIALADLDFFKSVNDTYGHEAGDEVLKVSAQLLKTGLRQSDVVGRLGGEEFLLLLTHATEEQARMAIERVREAIASHRFTWKGREFSVTASFGMAVCTSRDAADYRVLIEKADTALYLAKQSGRNRLEVDLPGEMCDA
jgi:diguanylate cyclase (GGDEF)-like protein